jgi:glycosyltransferase involved in cell wall biosynthesis
MQLSIIIANYNYRDFVGAAIASALAVDWPDKEVIVVDDASTDDSEQVIKSFGSRIAAYFRPKTNQMGAHIFGFEQSAGDVLIFLDADDLLEQEVMLEVAKAWRPGISKVQYRMNLIDATGTQLGSAIPQFPLRDDPGKLRREFLRTMAYTTPPGTGNAYSREFVSNAFAIAPWMMPASDTLLLTLAPLLGDVVTIRKPLARYRLHASNKVALGTLDAAKFRERLHEDVEKARLLKNVCDQLGLPIGDDLLKRNPGHLQYRLASRSIEPVRHPFPEDTPIRLVYSLICCVMGHSQTRSRDKPVLLVWAVACALSPKQYRKSLVAWRFAPTSRPALIKKLLGAVGSLRTSRLPDRA